MNYKYPLDYRLDGLQLNCRTQLEGQSTFKAMRTLSGGLDEWLDTVEEWPYGPYDSPQDAVNAVLDEYFACLD